MRLGIYVYLVIAFLTIENFAFAANVANEEPTHSMIKRFGLVFILCLTQPVLASDELVLAAYRGDLTKVKALLDAGDHINHTHAGGVKIGISPNFDFNLEGESALSAAAFSGELEVVHELLQRGAPIDAQHYLGKTPLHHASGNGHLSVVQELVKNDAELGLKNIWGFSAEENMLQVIKYCPNDYRFNEWKIIAGYLKEAAYNKKTMKQIQSSNCSMQ